MDIALCRVKMTCMTTGHDWASRRKCVWKLVMKILAVSLDSFFERLDVDIF